MLPIIAILIALHAPEEASARVDSSVPNIDALDITVSLSRELLRETHGETTIAGLSH